jgi:hypothetical protein
MEGQLRRSLTNSDYVTRLSRATILEEGGRSYTLA